MRKKALIVSFNKLLSFKKEFKNRKTVLVGGCFDILHFGHLKFLQNAALCGNYLIIALESDEFIINNKRKTPVHNAKERAEILSDLRIVDMVILLPKFDSDADYFRLVKIISPSIVAVTASDPKIILKKKQIEETGGQLKVVIKKIETFSTKKIYETFLSG